jgi:glycosyltransferase involved in cell wall biosynthesis
MTRIVPWDWTKLEAAPVAKTGPLSGGALTGFYAGALSGPKGVLDCLQAVGLANAQGLKMSMSFAGPGDVDHWRAEATRLGVADHVRFLGMVPNQDVQKMMQAHDIVVVPSRHDYAEGLPNTIYEALASRSPLIISDHPAFRGRLLVGQQCLEFKAGDAKMLADCMITLSRDRELYASLSNNAVAALHHLYVGMQWQDLIDQFLADPRNATGWVARNSLGAA